MNVEGMYAIYAEVKAKHPDAPWPQANEANADSHVSQMDELSIQEAEASSNETSSPGETSATSQVNQLNESSEAEDCSDENPSPGGNMTDSTECLDYSMSYIKLFLSDIVDAIRYSPDIGLQSIFINQARLPGHWSELAEKR
jgi:hypothetical protein